MALPKTKLTTRATPYPAFDGTQLCRELGPEAWFPPAPNAEAYAPLRETCARCPFLDACYAVSYDVSGFWAGTSLTERREARARLGIKPIPVSTSDFRQLALLLSELDDGTRPAHEVAIRARCTPETVYRHRQRKAAA